MSLRLLADAQKPLVVQPHWHGRYSGATTHIEDICGPLAKDFEFGWMGPLRPASIAAVSLREVWKRTAHERVVWHAHRNNDLLAAYFFRLFRPRLKVVFTRHGSYPPGWFSRWIARWSDALITLNDQNAEWMRQPSVVIPHGVDARRFAPPPGRREEAWARLGYGGRFAVGVVGRVRENKGQADFVEAIAPLLAKFPEWRAALIGLAQGSDVAWAKALQAQTGGALLLPGESRDIARWYQGLHVLVYPSQGESFGLNMVEGMAAGCCVVASRLFHVPKLIEHGRTGFLFEPRDVAALREILELLMREPDRAIAVGNNAAEEARGRLGIAHECTAIAKVYEEVLR